MDDILVPLTLALSTTVLAIVALATALSFMGDWSLRRRNSRR